LKKDLQIDLSPFNFNKKIFSKSPHKLDTLSHQKKKSKKTSSKLFEAARLSTAGETYLGNSPSKGTDLLRTMHIKRKISNQDTLLALSLKKLRMDIKNQYDIMVCGDHNLSMIIDQF
jgi:hypothetical protein